MCCINIDYYFSLMPGGLVFSSGVPKKKLQSMWPSVTGKVE